jgi:hypothetical protein
VGWRSGLGAGDGRCDRRGQRTRLSVDLRDARARGRRSSGGQAGDKRDREVNRIALEGRGPRHSTRSRFLYPTPFVYQISRHSGYKIHRSKGRFPIRSKPSRPDNFFISCNSSRVTVSLWPSACCNQPVAITHRQHHIGNCSFVNGQGDPLSIVGGIRRAADSS